MNVQTTKFIERYEIDPCVWVKEFYKINQNVDECLLEEWFSNAIMSGYNKAMLDASVVKEKLIKEADLIKHENELLNRANSVLIECFEKLKTEKEDILLALEEVNEFLNNCFIMRIIGVSDSEFEITMMNKVHSIIEKERRIK